MAGDWIPQCKNLSKKREVLAIAKATGKSRREVHSILLDFWGWADEETIDGFLPGITIAHLIETQGESESFWVALVEVGWLKVTAQGIEIPNFARWMGKSAKKRLKAALRMGMLRSRRNKSATTEQNRTEQNLGEESPKNPSCPEPLFAASELTEPATDQRLKSLDPKKTDVNPRPGRTQDRGGDDRSPDQAATLDPAGDPVEMLFPVVGGKGRKGPAEWPLRRSMVAEYQQAFPGIDVMEESRRALQWCRITPAKRKTYRGMPTFLFRWFSRIQNRVGRIEPGGSVGPSSRVRPPDGKYGSLKVLRVGETEAPQSAEG